MALLAKRNGQAGGGRQLKVLGSVQIYMLLCPGTWGFQDTGGGFSWDEQAPQEWRKAASYALFFNNTDAYIALFVMLMSR